MKVTQKFQENPSTPKPSFGFEISGAGHHPSTLKPWDVLPGLARVCPLSGAAQRSVSDRTGRDLRFWLTIEGWGLWLIAKNLMNYSGSHYSENLGIQIVIINVCVSLQSRYK